MFNLTNIAEGGTPITRHDQYINQSAMAEGLVGGDLPVVIFYYPVLPKKKNDCQAANVSADRSRYWTMIANPNPDMQGPSSALVPVGTLCMAKRGTKRVIEYARLAMGSANVRASRYGIR